jgi:hypothetical protein
MLSGCEKTNLPLISSATAIGCEARMQLTRVGLDRSCVDAVPYWRCPPLSCLTHTFGFPVKAQRGEPQDAVVDSPRRSLASTFHACQAPPSTSLELPTMCRGRGSQRPIESSKINRHRKALLPQGVDRNRMMERTETECFIDVMCGCVGMLSKI